MITEQQLQQAIDNAPEELKQLIQLTIEALDKSDYRTAYAYSMQITIGIVRLEAAKELLTVNVSTKKG